MRDARIDKLAGVLINYSAAVKKGDLVRSGGEVGGLPLIDALFEHVLRAGGHPFLQLLSDDAEDTFLRIGTNEQLAYQNPVLQFMADKIDVYIGIRGAENTRSRSNVPP